MAYLKIYSTQPIEKTLVNFIFTEHGKDCLSCLLIDYGLDAIMPFQLATLKKTIKNVNTLAPLNKPMIGTIEEIDSTITISIAYIDKESSDYKEFEKNNILMKNIISCIKKQVYANKFILEDFWAATIYPLDDIRDNTDLPIFILDNLDQIATVSQELADKIATLKYTEEGDIITKFKMISTGGIEQINTLIAQCNSKLKSPFEVYLDTTPFYYIKSPHIEKNKLFIEYLEKKGKELEKPIFVQV
jgi:hypothetical protein